MEAWMSNPALERVRAQALELSDEERAQLAHDLVASLDGESDQQAADESEVEVPRRLRQIDSGSAELIDRKEFSRRLRKRLNQS
jgi:hypothetical protein